MGLHMTQKAWQTRQINFSWPGVPQSRCHLLDVERRCIPGSGYLPVYMFHFESSSPWSQTEVFLIGTMDWTWAFLLPQNCGKKDPANGLCTVPALQPGPTLHYKNLELEGGWPCVLFCSGQASAWMTPLIVYSKSILNVKNHEKKDQGSWRCLFVPR